MGKNNNKILLTAIGVGMFIVNSKSRNNKRSEFSNFDKSELLFNKKYKNNMTLYYQLDTRQKIEYFQNKSDIFATFNLTNDKTFENVVGQINYEIKVLDTNSACDDGSSTGAIYNREDVCILLYEGSKLRYNQVYNRAEDPQFMTNQDTTALYSFANYKSGNFFKNSNEVLIVTTIFPGKEDPQNFSNLENIKGMPRMINIYWN